MGIIDFDELRAKSICMQFGELRNRYFLEASEVFRIIEIYLYVL